MWMYINHTHVSKWKLRLVSNLKNTKNPVRQLTKKLQKSVHFIGLLRTTSTIDVHCSRNYVGVVRYLRLTFPKTLICTLSFVLFYSCRECLRQVINMSKMARFEEGEKKEGEKNMFRQKLLGIDNKIKWIHV